ncbi:MULTISPECIES: helix-turn-helix domain-containing protein [Tessaracoccus]|uniref:Cupin domain-containing protein n=1 Tax=Tessaracoccus antarcticus TaxID=2479848 RepID=A0A3M0GBI3_9ACTN|nr:helix-turn-helix transcriptional regulator [Tessaracoccus antarcticus]RMB62401.1 cupin domain-containing protein [Tessaracoccus antarcticus]
MRDSEAPAAVDETLDAVGGHLRNLRHARAMTLEDLARSTGISQSTLSRVESGTRRPSLQILLQLAQIYQLTLDEVVGAPTTGDPRIHTRPSVRYGMTWLPLTRRPGGIQAYKLILPVQPDVTRPEQRSHEGYEWMYVLSGRLRLLLGDHDLTLTPGEVAEFDTRTPHAFTNSSNVPTELLMLIGPQGERAHIKAHPRQEARSSKS